MTIDTEILEKTNRSTKKTDIYNIVIYNDNVNTFQHVIETLIDVCGHNPIQAEQCTLLIHCKGKCEVKRGEYLDLLPICEALLERHLTAEIV